ncbi:hypothetical protein [Mycolicibacterium obuense]|uniref:hypothetical protein n=1 Tax=Mycolicibacterium obuense TaxID=1807 RepID=UPI0010396981|nr:hypothetical protein [Mycolicibacterium obuense]
MNLQEHCAESTLARLGPTLELCHRALTIGLATAIALHAERRWDLRADPQMFTHTVRREALEVIKAQNPDARAEDNLGAAMSGLHLTVGDTDVLRVWSGSHGQVRVPTSEHGREFLQQVPSNALLLPGFEAPDVKACRTILLWEHQGDALSQLTLVRPLGLDKGVVAIDWQDSVLQRFATRMDDIVYRRRATNPNQESQTS